MLVVRVILDVWILVLNVDVLMDLVSFGSIVVLECSIFVASMRLSPAICSFRFVFNPIFGSANLWAPFWWQIAETLFVVSMPVNPVMSSINCSVASCLEQSLFPIFTQIWSEMDEQAKLVL